MSLSQLSRRYREHTWSSLPLARQEVSLLICEVTTSMLLLGIIFPSHSDYKERIGSGGEGAGFLGTPACTSTWAEPSL